jgi:hypothetical protein
MIPDRVHRGGRACNPRGTWGRTGEPYEDHGDASRADLDGHPDTTEWLVLGLTVALVLVAGVVIVFGRRWLDSSITGNNGHDGKPKRFDADRTLVRSWLAIMLVGGLLFFCAVSFGLGDASLRSSLIGGLVASAGAATAFYFASKSSDEARRDILSASTPQVHIPNLTGLDIAGVNATLASLPLTLDARPLKPDPAWKAASQTPVANSSAPANSSVTVIFAGSSET